MKSVLFIALACSVLSVIGQTNLTVATSQQQKGKKGIIYNPESIPMVFIGESQNFRDVVIDSTIVHPITKPLKLGYHSKDDWVLNETINPNALPKNGDKAHQKTYNRDKSTNKSTEIGNWDGIGTTTSPGDPALDVGPNHVVQMLNGGSGAVVKIWNKTGGVVLNTTLFRSLAGTPSAGLGDPIVLYDERADRWLLSEFQSGGNNLYIAISTTPDPTGSYYVYSVLANTFPDYPKYSIWDNSYIVTANESGGSSSVYAMNRTSMLAGVGANAQRFTIPHFGTIQFQMSTPVSMLGTTVSGTPAMLMRMRDDAWTLSASDALEIWELDINWASPGAATLGQTQVLGTTPHETELCGYTSFACIPQQGSGTTLDPLREILMNRIMYRNFGTHESIVCSHVTDVDGSDWAGIRWYELRRTGGGGGTWSIYQEGTYAPDNNHRWMPTIGLAASGNIGLAYNVSSSSMHPEIRYTGRKECDPLGVMTEAEVILVDGTSPNNTNRWGDYNAMGVDPSDGETFWFTAQYNPTSQAKTRIGAFNIGNCSPIVQFGGSSYTINEPDAAVANGCLPYYVLNVPIQIGSDPTQPADVVVNVTGGTATQGVDYVINSTAFTFDDPTLSGNVEIWVYNDAYVEGNETITLDYTLNANGGNASTGTFNQTVTITINDDDLAPSAMTTISTILSQDFESGIAPFTTVNNNNTPPSGNLPWQIGNAAAASSTNFTVSGANATQFAWVNDDACNCNQSDVDLLFPSIDLTSFPSASLSLDVYYENNAYLGDQEIAEIRVSINGGAFTLVTPVIISTDWSTQTVDLTPYVGNADVQLAINYNDGSGWLYGCAVDNINITGAFPIGVQAAINTGGGDQANLGPNETVHFYDPATSDVMMTIVNTSAFDYGCITVEVDRDGSTPTALEFASAPVADYLHSKTFIVVPTNNNPTGTFDVTVYYEEAEVSSWEAITGNSRNNAEIIKVLGNNAINDVTPANYATFTIDNILATVGAFNADVTFTSSFTNGFSGFGVGIYNISPTIVTHTTVNTNLLCNGVATGSIVITASGGSAPYQYSIDGGTTWQGSNSFSGLLAGPYNVIVQDAGSIFSTVSIETLTEPTVISHTSVVTNLTCNGDGSGSIILTGSGGTGALQYSIDGGATFQGSGSFTGLSAATYSVVVEDVNGCQSTETITVTEPLVVSYSITLTSPTCNGGNDGQIVLVGNGGTGALQYSSDGGVSFQASGTFIGLSAGSYDVIVEDVNGCQARGTEILTEPTVVIHTSASTNLICNGDASGIIILTGSGGTGALQYSIDGGATFQGSGSFTGLSAATYSVVVEDVNGCQSTETITVTEPLVVSYSITLTSPTCNGGNDGQIVLVGNGGTGALQYSIDGGATFQASDTFTGLSATNYSVVIEDVNGCQATGSETLTEPSIVSHTSSFTNLICNSDVSGTITLNGSGGTGAFLYSIDGGATFQGTGSFTGLSAATYSVVVEDANGCQSTETITTTEPTVVSYSSTLTNLTCNGGVDGQIALVGSGGTGVLQYSINGGATFQVPGTFAVLSANTYSVVVEDANGCQITGSETLTEPTVVAHTSVVSNLICSGDASGAITLTGSGGTGAFLYSIDGGATFQGTGSFIGLNAATYSVVIEDANGCQSTETITVTEPPLIFYSGTLTSPTCNGGNDGQIVFVSSGGTGALQHSIDGGATFQVSGTFTGLSATTYSVIVEDANGCQVTGSEILTEPTVVAFIANSTDELCGSLDGTITINGSGGTGALQYSIDGGATFQASNSFAGLAAGLFNIVVEDVNNCQTTGTQSVGSIGGATITGITSTDPTCNGDGDASISISTTGGANPVTNSIDGGFTFQNPGNFNGLVAGVYSIVVKDGNGCQTTASVTITDPVAVSYLVSITDESCSLSNGTISLTGNGGTGALQYSIDGGATYQGTGLFTGLTTGIYSVIVEDVNGCQSTSSETVGSISGPVINTLTENSPLCNGNTNGSIIIVASGGSGILQYSIDGGTTFQASATFTNLGAGIFSIVVEDAGGCQATSASTLVDPTLLTSVTSLTNVSCNGGTDGEIALAGAGGTGALQYSIDGGATFQASGSFTGLNVATYSIVVEDANGCQITSSETLTEPTAVSHTSTFTNLLCNGDVTGTITLVGSGGTGAIQYSIDGGTTFQGASSFTGLSAATYSVVVEDANSCQSLESITLTEPTAVTHVSVVTNLTCNGDGSGSIIITGSGGTGALQYSIDGGTTFQGSNIFLSLSPATYSIIVEDVNGCQSTESITITEPALVSYSSTLTNLTCNAGGDGQIVLAGIGGTGALQYSIDGGTTFQASGTFTSLNANTYSVIVEDVNGCQASSFEILTEPTVVSHTSTFTNLLCNGDGSGTITLVGSGGTGAIQYSIDGGTVFQSSGTFASLNAATYSVIVEDANGCQSTESITITESALVSYSSTLTNLTCNANGDGQIVLAGIGGTGALQYSIDGGITFQGSGSFSGLPAGIYTVVVEDVNGCQATSFETLTEPTVVAFSSSATNLICNGSNTGTITLSASGGTGTYQYSIDGGATFQSSGAFVALSAGIYSVIAEDADGCQSAGTVTLSEPIAVTHTSVVTNLICNGDGSGIITLVGSGGSGALQYSIDGGTIFQASGTFTSLSAATYSTVIEDVNGCQSSETITVTEPNIVSYLSTLTTPDCNGGIDGQILLVGNGGTGAFQYSIDGGATFQASGTFTGLNAATYSIIIEDANGCQVSGSETLTEPASVNYTNVLVDPTCNGDNDGSISFSASGGVSPLSFSIDGGTTYQGLSSFAGLIAGIYNLVVSDGNSCTTTSAVTLTSPLAMSYTSIANPESCGLLDGAITINASGGTGAYQYSINGGTTFQVSNSFIGLSAGLYNVVIEDVNNCQASGTQNVGNLGGANITSIINTAPTCNGSSDASISIAVSGGTNPIQYSIDGGITFQPSNIFVGLSPATYSVVVEDGNGCQTNATITITDPPLVTYLGSVIDESCGLLNGSVSLTGNGGTGALQYSIDGGTTFQASGLFTGLNAATYSVVVEDANGCQITGSETVGIIGGPVINTVTENFPLCNGDANGSIFVAASGGSGTLQYSIDGGITFQVSATFTNLGVGIFPIVIEDAGGCQATSTATLTEPIVLTSVTNVIDVSCIGGNNGEVTLTASGGTFPYQYSIDGGITFIATSTYTGLVAGTYNYIIEDQNNCQVSGVVTVIEPTALVLTFSSTSPTCTGDLNGTITMSASGGAGFYQFSIDGGISFQGSGSFTGLAAGTYNLVLEDINGCQTLGTESISAPLVVSYGSSTSSTMCNGGTDGAITLTGSGGTGTLQYSIDGGTSFQVSGAFTGLSANVYSVILEDANGCQATGSITVTEPSAVMLTFSSTDPNCNGGSDGTITLVGSGGTGALQYSIDGGATFQGSGFFTGLLATTYSLVMEDGNGCQAIGSVSLLGPVGMTFSIITVDENCGLSDGELTFNVTGGVGAYQYSLDGGVIFQLSNTFSNLSAGSLNYVIEDGNGCQVSGVEIINNSSGVSIASISSTNPNCNGGTDGTITIAAAGGLAPLQYSIDGGATFQSAVTFTGLSVGSYNIVVEDASGCQITSVESLVEPILVDYSMASTPENCGLLNGTMTLSGSGGTGALQYSVDGGATFQGSGTFINLSTGSYAIVIEDANGCQSIGTEIVTGTSEATISSVTSTDPLCFGNNNGTITIVTTGGTGTLQYSIDGGVVFQSSAIFSGISAGNYSIVVSDAVGCQSFSNTVLLNPVVVTYSANITDENCGASDGVISIAASGGDGTYQYSIDGGVTFQFSSNFTGLTAGVYSVVVQDGNGCQEFSIETVNGTGGATITSATSVDVSCFGYSDGSITVFTTGGLAPLQYSADGGVSFQPSGTFTGLLSGSYIIVVEDASGCQELTTVIVNSPTMITTSVSINDASCGNNDGSATIIASGGNGTYTYQWDDVLLQTSSTAINLLAGIYNVVVSDVNGCAVSATALINNIGEPLLTISSVDALCYGSVDGSATANVTGGILPITYQWDDVNAQTTDVATNLNAGTYILQVTDAFGCIAIESVVIGQPDSLSTLITATNTTCGFDNGVAVVGVIGGISPYTYLWNDSQSQVSATAIDLFANDYIVTVIDANNCEITDSVLIADSDSLIVTVDVIHESCLDSYDGSIETAISGGLKPYSYLWSNGDTTQIASLLTIGNYYLTVGDADGCSVVLLVPIETLGENCISIPTAISPNGDGSNDVWNIKGLEDYPETVIEIYNRWGAVLFSTSDYQNDWDGTYNGKDIPAGVYYFIVKISVDEVYTGSLTVLR